MLTFLALAARKRYVVDAYRDQAVSVLGKDPAGNWAMTRVILRPEVRFGGEVTPSDEELRQLHDRAHHGCFIANSVKSEVIVEPR
jgi:organic hydroperoxide reductase OsmC/OhrA